MKRLCCLALVAALYAGAWADRRQTGPGSYEVGLPSPQFVTYAAPEDLGRQRRTNWCWAACIQMVLNYHGLQASQEEVVRDLLGGDYDSPANQAQVMRALQGHWRDRRGGVATVSAWSIGSDAEAIVADLDARWPLIVGLHRDGQEIGHAYVMTAAAYQLDASGSPQLTSVVLRDPWPGNHSRLTLNASEFYRRVHAVTRVRVQRN